MSLPLVVYLFLVDSQVLWITGCSPGTWSLYIDVILEQNYTHTYIHTYIHTCIHAYIHTYIDTYTYFSFSMDVVKVEATTRTEVLVI